jgi:hypothetical protein
VTSPLAAVVQLAGTQVPVAPAWVPVTAKSTSVPGRGVPSVFVTLAVTVWVVPTVLVAVSGASAKLGAAVMMPDPAIRM